MKTTAELSLPFIGRDREKRTKTTTESEESKRAERDEPTRKAMRDVDTVKPVTEDESRSRSSERGSIRSVLVAAVSSALRTHRCR